ncbi:spore coat polysaccharide biosynthesis protein SpsF [Clostridium saccharoperbutylacetonicum]|uniref:Spore coat polysaccharide biosynthesis protein F, CMP-KDO synthetase n=1 Tax=Clostridium saccharoperbutylacetonicum N1-4(HMT) TaxID=931276 RepID=M1MK63_9CLOT|nr:glycosyltransferase family protein [Clostridium saccharoperbutylacetonicum]AGF58289.1 spore coat polysaccharide biosynthesis protein F, CMP-KDO synthetase [Clostridium saccharoperbutylacetonicum N1-4(HMT)]NRT60934.1 spore coat polysaccharide biosynthesis protein SpsF [Clostridium saccharoperbutylacetonicum]NSB24247.1 spore coat polysaccharide biosynthesis protein SpsF [Clostridium saccharoperbutylacetonicum]NSB43625.1 spore coat polysaccharide biosynthesis protein SpsF [Clostridium saccharop
MKILCIVQARMGSERLPGKVMKKINNIPMISYTLNSLKESRYIDEVILATSTLEINNPLAEYVDNYGFEVYRGSEDNVLERYKLVSDKYNGDIIVRVTGDCPLINPIIVDHVVTKFLMYDYDYVRLDVPNTFQRGFDVEVFSKEALDKVYNLICSEENIGNEEFQQYREHVTLYIYNNQDEFKVGYVEGEGTYYENRNINLSVDKIEDFERVKDIIEK